MHPSSNCQNSHSFKNPPTVSDQDLRPRARKPSPGLAARLEALRIGIESNKLDTRYEYLNQIGRISEEQIKKLDNAHRASSYTPINTRGLTRRRSSGFVKVELTDGIVTEATNINLTMPEQDSTLTSEPLDTLVNSEEARINGHDENLFEGTKIHEEGQDSNVEDDDSEKCTSVVNQTSPAQNLDSNKSELECISSESYPQSCPLRLQRTGSVHTISRVSFTSQLAQLTSLQLPDAESLSTMISKFPTAKAASNALGKAAEQIQSWISKASDVIAGLASEDDVEWAAAGGREGLEEVDKSITRFEGPINVYVTTIQLLQNRTDIQSFSEEDLKSITTEVDTVLEEWTKIKNNLKEVKNSVEIAMEWEELWNTVLGDIGAEMDMLKKLVFEMEEIRHQSVIRVNNKDFGLAEIGSIIEERAHQSRNKYSTSNDFIISPSVHSLPSQPILALDDTNLLSLFARMQPLRASLDFFPMRLSAFLLRAKETFPTACNELENRLKGLEADWTTLETDAESLRKELGEDQWLLVFRVAGQQAQRIYESIERSYNQLLEAIESGNYIENFEQMLKRYTKKKNHYGSAIESVLSIIDKGVDERLTVNGEILRLNWEMKRKWDRLKDQMNELDEILADDSTNKKPQEKGDFTTTTVLTDYHPHTSFYSTPGSSPISTNFLTIQQDSCNVEGSGPPQAKRKSKLPQPDRRISSLPVEKSRYTRQSLVNNPSDKTSPASYPSKNLALTPMTNHLSKISVSGSLEGKPRWNSSTKIQEGTIGHNFKPFNYTTPSPNFSSKSSVTNPNRVAVEPKAHTHSPMSRHSEMSTATEANYSFSSTSRISFRERLTERISSSCRSLQNVSKPSPQPRLRSGISLSELDTGCKDQIQSRLTNKANHTPPRSRRSISSLGTSRRVSFLPVPKHRLSSS